MAKRRAAVVPDRRWSADVILPATDSKPEVRYTSVIYGSNPSEAETRKVAELGNGARVILRAELR